MVTRKGEKGQDRCGRNGEEIWERGGMEIKVQRDKVKEE
jgi:hypothetical protein